MGLFGDGVVAIDGSKFKAVNNRDQNFTPAKMQRRLAEIEAAIARYMAEMDGADAAEPGGEARVEHLEQKLAVASRLHGGTQAHRRAAARLARWSGVAHRS